MSCILRLPSARQLLHKSTKPPCPFIVGKHLAINKRLFSQNFSKMSGSNGIEVVSTTASAAPAAPYSQAIKANGQIWVSGQVHYDESGNKVEGSVAERTAQCCKNLKAILEAGGSSMDKIVRVGVFLVDMKDFAEMNEEYKKWFPLKPARACVAVHQLPLGCTVEIEAIALA